MCFFNIQARVTIPLRIQFANIGYGSFYLGSSLGCLFLGRYTNGADAQEDALADQVIGLGGKRKRDHDDDAQGLNKQQQEQQQQELQITIINPFMENSGVMSLLRTSEE